MVLLLAALGRARLGAPSGLRLARDLRTFIVLYSFTPRSRPLTAIGDCDGAGAAASDSHRPFHRGSSLLSTFPSADDFSWHAYFPEPARLVRPVRVALSVF